MDWKENKELFSPVLNEAKWSNAALIDPLQMSPQSNHGIGVDVMSVTTLIYNLLDESYVQLDRKVYKQVSGTEYIFRV